MAAVFPPVGTKDNDVTRCCKFTIAKDEIGKAKGQERREDKQLWNLPEGKKLHSVAHRLHEGKSGSKKLQY